MDNYNSSNVWTSGSNKNGISPSASIMYKPTAATTAYATYASSLQQGDIAAGRYGQCESVACTVSQQGMGGGIQDGWAASRHYDGVVPAGAPFANTVPYGNTTKTIFEITGQQVNYGAEISAQGTLFRRLLVNGGFTALNARLNDTPYAATNGKRFVGIPSYKSNLLSEYRVPGVANLSITGDWQFVGRRPQDDENLHSTVGYNTFDLGFRYSRMVFTKLMTLRFTTDNITNTRYYSTIAAGDITGTNASSNTAHLGSPRAISTSLQIAF